ncbi:SH3-like domain-containing protein, partial [Enterococcus phoeniculicola]
IGWLDAQAFYEPIIEEIDVNYSVEIVDSAKNQGAWSAPYNTESNIIGYGKGSQYVGQQGTVDKIVRTTRSGYWRVTLDGKTFWLDEVSFKKVVKKATIDISDENESDTIDSSQSETEESIINTSETSEPSNKDGIVESSDNIENIMEQTSSDSIIDSEEVMESTVD